MDYQFHDSADGQAPSLAPIIGKVVAGVWMLPDGVFVSFTTDEILEVKPMKTVGFKGGLAVRIGESKQRGFDWGTVLDESLGTQPEECTILRGMKFEGFDADVMVFGDYGIKVTLGGYAFVRVPGAPIRPEKSESASLN